MTGTTDEKFLGEDKEWLVQYAKDKLKEDHFDYFIFGHRHLPIDCQLKEDSRYINLGDWIKYNSYAEFDGTTIQLKYYQ
jgi:UDP-2,3-diacylglucosamine hydrolase